MLPDVKSVWPVIVGCDLDRQPHTVANIFDKLVSRPVISLSNAMRKDQLRVRVDATPKPEIATLFLWIKQPTSMRSHVLPLLIHLDSDARQITKVSVHVIRERFASFANDALDRV